jgi:hypothetical protein
LRYWSHEHKPEEKESVQESHETLVERKSSKLSKSGKGKIGETRRVASEGSTKEAESVETETQPRTAASAKKVPVLFIDEAHKL